METKEYRMLQSGESPDFGIFEENQIITLPVNIGDPLVARGVAEEVKSTKKTTQASAPDTEA